MMPGHRRHPWPCAWRVGTGWRVCGRGGGIARRGPAVGLMAGGARPETSLSVILCL